MKNRNIFLLIILSLFLYQCKKNEEMLSPIDITSSELDTSLNALFNDYKPTDITLKNKGNYLLIDASDNFLVIPKGNDYLGEEVELKGILIKSPSEHTVNGKHYPLELQFFHTDTNQNIVIASVFVEPGNENSEFEKIVKNLTTKNESKNIQGVDLYSLFPLSTAYWFYQGTTTNEPIKECRWFVMKTPIQVSQEQIDAIQDLIGKNIIETVDLGDRKIYKNE